MDSLSGGFAALIHRLSAKKPLSCFYILPQHHDVDAKNLLFYCLKNLFYGPKNTESGESLDSPLLCRL